MPCHNTAINANAISIQFSPVCKARESTTAISPGKNVASIDIEAKQCTFTHLSMCHGPCNASGAPELLVELMYGMCGTAFCGQSPLRR